MNEKIVNDGFTYKHLVQLLKKSFLRIIIYVLIAAFVTAGIGALIIVLTKEETSYNAMIEYNYDGAELGLDPWGMRLDVSKIKSDAIVTQALIDNNYSEEERAELKNGIISNITIAGVVPDKIMDKILIIKEIAIKNPSQLNELNTLSYFSTSYVVSLKNERKLGLSAKECANILNTIVDNYILYFKQNYGFSNALGTLIGGDVNKENYEYIELHSIYYDQIDSILRYINDIAGSSNSFRSTETKLSFNDLKARVQSIIDYDLNKLEIYIYENGVSKGSPTINAATFIDEKISYLNREIDSADATITAILQSISEFEFVYNTTTSENITTSVLANGAAYEKLQDDLRIYQTRKVELTSSKDLWETRKTKILNAEAMTEEEKALSISTADALIGDIDVKIKKEIGYINQAVDEYVEKEIMKNSVVKTFSAIRADDNNDSLKILLVVEMLVMLTAALIAVGITATKAKKIEVIEAEEKE